jgi:hypothetical protein
MKKKILTISAGFILWLSTLPATAQKDVRPVPSWVSERGYWVVESNVNSSIVYFYNNDNHLVYKERVNSVLNTDRRRTKLRLTKALEQSVTAWEKDSIIREDRQLLAKLGKPVPGTKQRIERH